MPTDDRTTQVRIQLPAPISVVAAIGEALGTLWPDATIEGAPGTAAQFNLPGDPLPLTRARAKRIRDNVAALDDGTEGDYDMNRFAANDVTFGGEAVERAVDVLAAAATTVLDHNDAPNYVEMELRPDDGTDQRIMLVVARSPEQTPHALLAAAKERVAELEAQVAALENERR